ncbi:hypothetical protein L1049_016522 [Liquidambar formosana]|uniref:Uncharacterized protein n=1 Tax=Liquidambar formosana TaxID=63359 RepID=A0AAP0S5B7_LIQFO
MDVEMADGNQSNGSLKLVGGIGKKSKRKFEMGKGNCNVVSVSELRAFVKISHLFTLFACATAVCVTLLFAGNGHVKIASASSNVGEAAVLYQMTSWKLPLKFSP